MPEDNGVNPNPTPLSQDAATATPVSDTPTSDTATASSAPNSSAPSSDTATSTNPTTDTPTAPVNPATASTPAAPEPSISSTIVTPSIPDIKDIPEDTEQSPEVYSEVAKKIGSAHNVLIALSSDPSVDEMATAIGLSLYLDRLGKRATAIYSGSTPNALEFLKPEDTFESTADTLQDFVIALNKDKADHLRYKLDGDFVKIFITPYKTRISEEDLEFSYGDFNVDLVLALDVANGIDLDSALREHGRIMHDAVIINITTGKPGKFGEIELSDKSASSVAEIIAKLLYSVNSKIKIEKEEATAFLTGIVAATNRFSNTKTTPETMKISSRLMESGANQQLISKNITPDLENEMYSMGTNKDDNGLEGKQKTETDEDPTKLSIEHGEEAESKEEKIEKDEKTEKTKEPKTEEVAKTETVSKEPEPASETKAETAKTEVNEPETTIEAKEEPKETESPEEPTSPEKDTALLDDLKAAEASLSQAGTETAPDIKERPVKIEDESFISDKPEKVIEPPADFSEEATAGEANKYGQMLEDALAGLNSPASVPEPVSPTPTMSAPSPEQNPAMISAPAVATAPEINGVPEMNYMPMPGEEVLPPPPTPPIDMNTPITPAPSMPEPTPAPAPEPNPVSAPVANPEPASMALPNVAPVEPAMPAAETPATLTNPLGPQPAMQDQVYRPQASDPSAFKIPGM